MSALHHCALSANLDSLYLLIQAAGGPGLYVRDVRDGRKVVDLAEGHIKKLIEHAEQAFEEQTCSQLGVDNPFLFRQLALHPREQLFSPIRPKDLVSPDGEDDVGSD